MGLKVANALFVPFRGYTNTFGYTLKGTGAGTCIRFVAQTMRRVGALEQPDINKNQKFIAQVCIYYMHNIILIIST
jgi:hypothetical protein